MTTQLQRAKWTTFNTWAQDRRKAKRASQRAHRELQQLINKAPAALAAAQNRRTPMTSRQDDAYWTPEAMEARQEARRALLARCGNPPRREKPVRVPSEREKRLAAGLVFSVAEEDAERADAEHRARRRQADAKVAERARLWQALRDSEGIDYADQWMNGDDAA